MKVHKHNFAQSSTETETEAEVQTEAGQPLVATSTFYSNDNIPRREVAISTTTAVPLENIAGTIRFREEDGDGYSQVRISLTGFEPLKAYSVVVNENPDVTNRCTKVGPVFNPGRLDPPVGFIVYLKANEEGSIYTTISEYPIQLSGNKRQSILNRSITIHKVKSTGTYNNINDLWGSETIIDCAPIVRARRDIDNGDN